MVTLPALFLATYLVGIPWLTTIVAVFCAVVALVALVASIRSKYPILRRIARESLPVLVARGHHRRDRGHHHREALRVVPRVPGTAGAGAAVPRGFWRARQHPERAGVDQAPPRHARAREGESALDRRGLSSSCTCTRSPCFFLLGVSSDIAALVVGLKSPGSLEMIAVSMLAGVIATTFAVLVGFYGAIAAHRLGLDPDNHGIPIVTSSLEPASARSRLIPGDRGPRPHVRLLR